MRVFIAVLFLIFSLQSLSKADDIRDFEIEGMSIGDSALDYFSKKQIKKNSYKLGTSDKYLTSVFYDSKYKNYDAVEISYKKNDKKFIIESISGAITVNNINECKKRYKEISENLKSVFPNSEIQSDEGFTPVDKYKKSKYYRTAFHVNPNSKFLEIEVSCIFYKGKAAKKFRSSAGVTIKTDKYNEFLLFEAYK